MKFKRPQTQLQKIAISLARNQEETELLAKNYFLKWRLMIFGALFLTLAIIYFPSLYRGIGPHLDHLPDVVLTPDKWKAIYEGPNEQCTESTVSQPTCLANVKNQTLWKSKFNRSDSEHADRVRKRIGKDFWIGVILTPDILRDSFNKMANHLVLGWFNASYRIWVDGELLIASNGWTESSPIIVTFSKEKLKSLTPIYIAIQVIHDGGTLNPDTMNEGSKEGLYSAHTMDQYSRVVMLMTRARPFLLFASYVVFALTCILFWQPSKKKPEYYFLGLYALICGFNQARLFDLFWSGVSIPIYQTTAFYLGTLEYGLAMIMAFSFSRMRERYIALSLAFVFLMPLLCVLFYSSNADLQWLKHLSRAWAAPTYSLIGAIVCLIPAFKLRNKGLAEKKRSWQLFSFSLLLVIMGLLEGKIWWFTQDIAKEVWQGVEHLLLIIMLGGIILKDFGKQAETAANNPVSSYHLREGAPAKLKGLVIVAKFRHAFSSDEQNQSTDIETENQIWRSHFFNSIIRAKGTVIDHKKESLMAFFDEAQCENPILSAMNAMEYLDMTTKASASMLFEFSGKNTGTYFSASIGAGFIRPTWEEVGSTREPNWEEAGDTTPFVDAARLLEMEGQVIDNKSGEQISVVLMRSEVCEELLSLDQNAHLRMVSHNVTAFDKHKQAHQISAYVTGKNSFMKKVA